MPPSTIEHRKLQKYNTPLATYMHPSWRTYIQSQGLPTQSPLTFASLTRQDQPPTETPKRTAALSFHSLSSPISTKGTPLAVLEVHGHKTLLQHTVYHVNQWGTEHLSARYLCRHNEEGLKPSSFTRLHSDDEDTSILSIQFQVQSKSAWVTREHYNVYAWRKQAVEIYHNNKASQRTKTRTHPPITPPQTQW